MPVFLNHTFRCMKAETCLLRIHIPKGPSLEEKQQLSQLYPCTAAVSMALLVRLDFTAPSVLRLTERENICNHLSLHELLRIRRNDELEAIIKRENIVRFIKCQRKRWFGLIY